MPPEGVRETPAVLQRAAVMAHTPVLLVVCDYDGTLADGATDPRRALPRPEAIVALNNLVLLPQTHVAIVSGRSRESLAELTGAPPGLALVGGYGCELEADLAAELEAGELLARAAALEFALALAARDPGFFVEERPTGCAFHYRGAGPEAGREAVAEFVDFARRNTALRAKPGPFVLELSIERHAGGRALRLLTRRTGADRVVYLGGDESVFGALGAGDLGVHVGEGAGAAEFRVRDTLATAELLAALHEHRRAWLEGRDTPRIEELALLSDQSSAALVAPDASLVWYCAPRLDAPPLLAELIGGGGAFEIRPVGAEPAPRQRYLHDSLVLETRWQNLRLVDYLDTSGVRAPRHTARTNLVRVLEGHGVVEVLFEPRPDFGRRETRLVRTDRGLAIEGDESVTLVSRGVRWSLQRGVHGDRACARVTVEFEPVVFELRHGPVTPPSTPGTPVPEPFELGEHERRLATIAHWQSWLSGLVVPQRFEREVKLSALALKGLCIDGTFAAAATTSLPEFLGGRRNWDERCVRVRDAASCAEALLALGSGGEALAFLDWLRLAVARGGSAELMRPYYALDGGEPQPETVVTGVAGYADSRPVRSGRSLRTRHLETYGPVVDLVFKLACRGAPLTAVHWEFVVELVAAVARRWQEPDHGLWEIRGAPRHHVHSKVMCWLAVDRALRTAELLRLAEPEGWSELRAAIASEVLERGWNAGRSAFTGAYGSDDLDAAALWVGLAGLVPPEDERFRSTLTAVERELRRGPAVYTHGADDGAAGRAAGVTSGTPWLVDSLLIAGRSDDAERLMANFLELTGPTGLASARWCPRLERALGNHPSAATHAGLIKNALHLCALSPASAQAASGR